MKNISLILLAILVTIGACKKEETNQVDVEIWRVVKVEEVFSGYIWLYDYDEEGNYMGYAEWSIYTYDERNNLISDYNHFHQGWWGHYTYDDSDRLVSCRRVYVVENDTAHDDTYIYEYEADTAKEYLNGLHNKDYITKGSNVIHTQGVQQYSEETYELSEYQNPEFRAVSLFLIRKGEYLPSYVKREFYGDVYEWYYEVVEADGKFPLTIEIITLNNGQLSTAIHYKYTWERVK